jgi:glycerol uptake facilitator-like aquaporin
MTLSRRAVAEVLGTAFLLTAVVGSGIMGQKLAGGNMGIALLANTLATGATLVTLIFTFGPISGGHFNPAVTLADASQGGISWRDVPAYIGAQLLGAFIGLGAAHLMFGEALIQISQHARAGGGQLFSEFVATFRLLCVIWGCGQRKNTSSTRSSSLLTGPKRPWPSLLARKCTASMTPAHSFASSSAPKSI